ncbi:hypothetical protein [Halobellus sp. Atlit-38R]|uniref:hypothetical protein n=1 Tax=Halobellus sp. Atlit-38R TaxID=2282131 RepID=UPI0011C3897F|nr:hypothetical protein [Halobellus sp. Atlit-38R]
MVSDAAGDVPADPSVRERAERAISRRRLLVAGGPGSGAGALTQLRTDSPSSPSTDSPGRYTSPLLGRVRHLTAGLEMPSRPF